jgi:TPR repeat protein
MVRAAILFVALCVPAIADLAAGQQALKNGDYATAHKEFLPLARQGSAVARFAIGFLYDEGHGVAQDYAEAAKWYRLAAAQRQRVAQSNLGDLYATGRGVAQDYAEAAKWYGLAADQGEASAQSNLGVLDATGHGVPQDYVQAHLWFNLAGASGNASGIKYRDIIVREMTPEQIAEAQRRARRMEAKNLAAALEKRVWGQ